MMEFTPQSIAALVIATSFAAGLNVYATVLTLGLLSRMEWIALPSGLESIGATWVLTVCGVLFAAEFVADKIPGFDLVWNAAQTFVRVPVAALMAYKASEHLTPGMQALVTVLAAGVAMAAHSSKLAVRGVVTPSPEPVSNIALSAGEDVGAIGLTWVAVHHPLVAGGVVVVILGIAVVLVRTIVRRTRGMWQRMRARMAL